MRNTRIPFFAAALIIAVTGLFLACHKSPDNTFIHPTPTKADQLVTASLQGRVLDENGLPVMNAAVSSGSATTTTDVNGVFRFNNIQIYSRFGFVKVTKSGYFTGSRTISTNPGVVNYVEIDLLPRSSKGSFTASSGGTVTVQSGTTVAFTGGSVVNAASNAAYSGNVNVYATYLDPTASGMTSHMPGDLRGIAKDNSETGLQSFGMLAVELEGGSGEKLQIAAGQQATITMAIPASLQGSAPASIPLWYFNDTTGKWMEQGTATRQGNNYVGQVGHFSWWNCDLSVPMVKLTLHLKDQGGNALPYTNVLLSSSVYGTRGAYTDSSGLAQGMIPQGGTYSLQVLNMCAGALYSKDLGTINANQDLGTITVTVPGQLVLQGTAVDCFNNPVASGYVLATVDGMNYAGTVTNGAFTVTANRCGTTATTVQLFAGDFGAVQRGSAGSFTVTNGTVNVGQLSACGTSLDQYLALQYNNTTLTFSFPPDSSSYNVDPSNVNSIWLTSRWNSGPERQIYFSFTNPGGVTGTFPAKYFSVINGNSMYLSQGTPQVTISSYGNAGGYVQGTISGTLVDSLNKSLVYPATGNFRLKRQN